MRGKKKPRERKKICSNVPGMISRQGKKKKKKKKEGKKKKEKKGKKDVVTQ